VDPGNAECGAPLTLFAFWPDLASKYQTARLVAMPPAGTLQMAFSWRVGPKINAMFNVLHANSADPLDQNLADSIAAEFENTFEGSATQDNISEGVQLDYINVKDLSNQVMFQTTNLMPIAGDGTTNLLPVNTSLVTTIHSVEPGRRGRGRIFLGGWVEGASIGINPEPGVATAANNFWETLASAMQTNLGVILGVFSRLDDVVYNHDHFVTNNVWDTQRRRQQRWN